MAEKTLILKVDLECSRCREKISKILGKLQGKENIKAIVYDEKNNTVMISGPFDAQKLLTKLSHRAGKVIKDIKEKEKPKESKPAEATPAEKKKPEKEDKPAEKQPEKENKPEKDEKNAEKKTEKEETPAKIVLGPPEPVPIPQPTCCPTPYYERYYGGCRCSVCGQIFGYNVVPPWGPNYAPPYDGYSVYHFSSEEDPSASTCTIM